jgi:hypothetical protein
MLEVYEDAHRSRAIKLGDLLSQLTALNLRQERLFRQSIRCAENGIYLAGHVMTWAAIMDLYEEKLSSGLATVRREYPKWPTSSLEDLRESVNEFQLIDAGKKVGLLTKGQHRSMHGHLHTRNQAAHPTGFDPGINESLGYIEALIKLVKVLDSKTL